MEDAQSRQSEQLRVELQEQVRRIVEGHSEYDEQMKVLQDRHLEREREQAEQHAKELREMQRFMEHALEQQQMQGRGEPDAWDDAIDGALVRARSSRVACRDVQCSRVCR